jgi:hypothetical protein
MLPYQIVVSVCFIAGIQSWHKAWNTPHRTNTFEALLLQQYSS